MLKKFVLILLLCLMAVNTALAGDFAPDWQGLNRAMQEGAAIKIEITPALHAFGPFSSERIQSLNRLFNHFRADVITQSANGSAGTDFEMFIGDNSALFFRLRETSDGSYMDTSFTGNDIMRTGANGSPLDILLGGMGDENEFPLPDFEEDVFFAASDFETLRSVLALLPDDAKTAKKKKKFDGIGTSATTLSAQLSPESLNGWLDAMKISLQTPRLRAFFHALPTFADGADAVLYLDGNDVPMALTAELSAVYDDIAYKVTVTWSFAVEAASGTDIVRIDATANKGKDKVTIEARLDVSDTSDMQALKLIFGITDTHNKVETVDRYEADLKNVIAEGGNRLLGSVTRIVEGETRKTSVTMEPSLVTVRYGDAVDARGNIRVVAAENGVTVLDVGLSLALSPSELSAFDIPERTVSLDTMGEAALEALTEQALSRAAEDVIRAALRLPMSELALLSDYLDENSMAVLQAALDDRAQ